MSSIGKVTMEMDKDVVWLFKATRVMLCENSDCKNHHRNHVEDGERWDCALKTIYIKAGGACGYYEPAKTKKMSPCPFCGTEQIDMVGCPNFGCPGK